MRIRFLSLIIIICFCSCEIKTTRNVSNNSEIENPEHEKIGIEKRTFFVGDINNDKINDTAFVTHQWKVDTNEIEYKKNCTVTIEFRKKIPKISFSQSSGIVVMKTKDVNHDNANEIIIFSRTNEGFWNNISIWSFKNKKWKEIATCNAFISNDKDFENRVIEEKGNYFLVGEDKWSEDDNGDFKKIKVKL